MKIRQKGATQLSAMGVALMAAAMPVAAADADADVRIRELERKLERSMQMIEALQNKVQTLEGTQAPARVTSANAEPDARIEALQQQVAQLGTGLASRSNEEAGLPVHGFADVGAVRSGEDNANYGKGKKGFNVGNFDLYLSTQLSTNVRALAELVFEVDEQGGVSTDLERLQIGYAASDAFVGWLGRFHTPYGYWNTAFHHGAQIQTSVLRPRFLDFEDKGGILPAHTTGGWATGVFDLGSAKLGYDAYVGNAQHIRDGVLDMQMGGSQDFRGMGGFNAWYTPKSLSALRLGVHGIYGSIENDNTGDRTRLNMLGGYGVFLDDNWEALGEYYHFDNKDQTGNGDKHQSYAWYAQLGYSLGQWTPYGRYERTSLDQADNYFLGQANGRSYKRAVLGLRFDVNPKTALKFELNRTTKMDLQDLSGGGLSGPGVADDTYNEAYIQYSIRF